MKILSFERITVIAIALALAVVLIACTSTGWETRDREYWNPYYGTSSSSSGTYGNGRYSDYDRSSYGEDVDPSCVDESGFEGRGCYKCAPKTNEQLLNACTDAHYETFDDLNRIGNFNPQYPLPGLGDAGGATPPPYVPASDDPTDPLPPAPPCLAKANAVYLLGGTGFPFEAIAKAMGSQATIFFQEKGSCDGVASILLGDPKLSGEVIYYGTDGTANRCSLAEPHAADVGLSSLFAESCGGASGLAAHVELPSDVEDFTGPASTVMFTVPATSSERAISATAAYRVYGLGDDSQVYPWTDERFIFRRNETSGNQQTVALSLGLRADHFRGRDSSGSSNMLAALRTSANPGKTIGISSSEIVDPNRDVLKALAYRHFKQPVAFYPDSDRGALDRRNVRDGHYFLWLRLHVFARTRGGEPVAADAVRNDAVKRLLYVMTNRQEPPVKSVDLLGAYKRTGNVPTCAMHVKRAREGAPLEPASPAVPCDCAFEAASPGSTASECRACDSSNDCPDDRPMCSFGYCEKGH